VDCRLATAAVLAGVKVEMSRKTNYNTDFVASYVWLGNRLCLCCCF